MSNSRSRFRAAEKPTNTNKGHGLILETPYRPGFVDDKDLETVKMAVDKELSEVSNAFYQTTERTADTIKRVDKLEITGETQYGELIAKIEEVDTVSKEGDEALSQRITTLSAHVDTEFGNTNALIQDESEARANEDMALANRITTIKAELDTDIGKNTAAITTETNARVEADTVIANRIDSILGSMQGDLGPLVANIYQELNVLTDKDKAQAQEIKKIEADYQQADKDLNASITTETTARVEADKALSSRIDKVSADMVTEDSKLSAAITTEQQARVDGDGALASEISKVEAGYIAGDKVVDAAVKEEAIARATEDSALSAKIDTVSAEMDGKYAEIKQFATVEIGKVDTKIDGETASRLLEQAVLDDKITAEEAKRLYEDGVLAGEIDTRVSAERAQRELEQAVLEGKITAEEAARLYQDGILNNYIDDVNDKADTINAKWGVEIDVNGKISGIVMNNNGARSNFEVLSDVFSFRNHQGQGMISAGGNTAFTGTVYAQAGDFNNVTVRENCTILGTINAAQVRDDIIAVRALGSDGSWDFGVKNFARTVSVQCSVGSGFRSDQPTGIHVYVNGGLYGTVEARAVGGAYNDIAISNFGCISLDIGAGVGCSVSVSSYFGSGGSTSALAIVNKLG